MRYSVHYWLEKILRSLKEKFQTVCSDRHLDIQISVSKMTQWKSKGSRLENHFQTRPRSLRFRYCFFTPWIKHGSCLISSKKWIFDFLSMSHCRGKQYPLDFFSVDDISKCWYKMQVSSNWKCDTIIGKQVFMLIFYLKNSFKLS